MTSFFLQGIQVHPEWDTFLTKDVKEQLVKIEISIADKNFVPPQDKVLRFLELSLKEAKIVILGQDPYPQPGVATGRSFEVGNLRSWNEPFQNISLKNILRAIYKAYSGEVIKFNELKAKFDNEFPLLPPYKLFSSWEEQGVLLLNTYFTCETGKPGSHQKLWEPFSKKLFEFIYNYNRDLIWFVWGSNASSAVSHLGNINSLESYHPMMCYNKPGRVNDFLYGNINCFENTKNRINWTGFPVDPVLKVNRKLF